MQDNQDFRQLLSGSKKIVLTIHLNPDADALGSALGFALVLQKKGHEVTVVSPNTFPEFLKWMKGNESVLVFDKEPEACNEVMSAADIIFSLDYSAIK